MSCLGWLISSHVQAFYINAPLWAESRNPPVASRFRVEKEQRGRALMFSLPWMKFEQTFEWTENESAKRPADIAPGVRENTSGFTVTHWSWNFWTSCLSYIIMVSESNVVSEWANSLSIKYIILAAVTMTAILVLYLYNKSQQVI